MDAATRELVWSRAHQRCEYCLIHQDDEPFYRLHVEHVIAKQHGGADHPDNLALACHHDNEHKGPNLSGIDPKTGKVVRLFHPRRQRWSRHFRFAGPIIVGANTLWPRHRCCFGLERAGSRRVEGGTHRPRGFSARLLILASASTKAITPQDVKNIGYDVLPSPQHHLRSRSRGDHTGKPPQADFRFTQGAVKWSLFRVPKLPFGNAFPVALFPLR